MRNVIVAIVVVAVLAAGAWFVFGRDGQGGTALLAPGDADAPLAYVPADSPYVFANLEALPADKLAAWMQQSEAMAEMWRLQYEQGVAAMKLADPSGAGMKWANALDAEFRGKTLQQALDVLGVDLASGRSAIYGIGLVPVVRMSLAKPDNFRGFLARVETAAGEKLPAAKLGTVDYWQFTTPEAPLRGIMALQGNHLVMTVAPKTDDAALGLLLGVDKPAQSQRDGKQLAEINAEYGYLPYATGYLDTTRLVALIGAPATPVETAFLSALEIQKPAIDAVCQAEYAALAQAAPRFVLGYTKLEPKESIGVSHLELRDDLAKDLMTLRAPMPGLAAGADSLFNFGLSLKVAQLPPLVAKWSDAVKAAPWQCASLQELNTAYADAATQLNNPAVFMAGPVFEGVHAIVTKFTMPQPGAEHDISGLLLIGSPSPKALLATAGSFVPPLAAMKLEADGQVQPVPAMPGMPPNLPAHVAMTDTLIGIAVGAGQEATLPAAMKPDPAQQPLFVIGYSGAAFTEFAQQMQATLDAAETDPAKREESRKAMEMMAKMYAMIRRVEMRVEFDESGIVFHQAAQMN